MSWLLLPLLPNPSQDPIFFSASFTGISVLMSLPPQTAGCEILKGCRRWSWTLSSYPVGFDITFFWVSFPSLCPPTLKVHVFSRLGPLSSSDCIPVSMPLLSHSFNLVRWERKWKVCKGAWSCQLQMCSLFGDRVVCCKNYKLWSQTNLSSNLKQVTFQKVDEW